MQRDSWLNIYDPYIASQQRSYTDTTFDGDTSMIPSLITRVVGLEGIVDADTFFGAEGQSDRECDEDSEIFEILHPKVQWLEDRAYMG